MEKVQSTHFSHYQLTMLHKILKLCYLGRGLHRKLNAHVHRETKHYNPYICVLILAVMLFLGEAHYHQDNIGTITDVSFTYH